MPPDSEQIDKLQAKLKALDETLWDGRAKWDHVERWLAQFNSTEDKRDDAYLQMLFLASNFMYFGVREIRALLRSLFRDLYQYKVVEKIRAANNHTLDRTLINSAYEGELKRTRFIGVGNPSESGSHMLYYFRQENRLGKQYFINSLEVFSTSRRVFRHVSKVKDPNILHYVLIDDLCGSGTQARQYCESLVRPLKQMNKKAKVYYYTLFATTFGLNEIRKLGWFDEVGSVVELDDSFRCFGDDSRVYKNASAPFDKAKAKSISLRHGHTLFSSDPLGYRDGQLLIGFFHNTPDNTLPIIWFDDPDGTAWIPLFRRFPKQYGWQS
ncbi:hypothetical protein [Bradyrhizobium sp. RP6]|uniref:phosphoribosyltransferase-like protein n=1 Tax=Bradyrhizobium sp. RP6 TaxID=2489596 RepID=UPI000F53052B|nr:hypothetical protein [Bradyrhizobium sp. RP6]RQH12742.1 hypothetical protein EHH60_14750 [Bradyrhizobium sp. RP6]